MRGSKKHNVASFRMGPASVGVVLLAGLGASVLSCDEMERHQMLTFFFDGVPPAGSRNFEKELVSSNSQEPEPSGQESVWYMHEPQKDCANCHQKQRMGRFSAQTRLLAPVPKLCHNCHPDFMASALFVHGPVAVGQCLFCHNPHKSKVKHLLNGPEPKLCYLCHDMSMVELIPAHLAQQTSACTDCHNPHAASTKALLKGAISPSARAPMAGGTTGATVQDNVEPVKEHSAVAPRGPSGTADQAALERQNVFEVFWQVSRLIEQGEMKKARAQLETLKDNKALTPEEREKILNVLGLMDGASAGSKPNGSATQSPKSGDLLSKQEREIADLYYRSMAFYRDGHLTKAKEGFIEVLKSGLIPDPMAETVRRYVLDIDLRLAQGP
jgi:predicted CXXCH cytochrome family protein